MKGPLRLLLLLCLVVPLKAQYLEQCLNVTGFTDDEFGSNSFNFNSTVRTNASKEFVLVGDLKLYRVSKEGTKLWEKTLTSGIYDYGIDPSGNVAAIHNGGSKLIKYNSNGTQAWEKTYTNQSVNKLFIDNSGNIYVTGYDNNTSGLLLIKYESNGNQAWQKIVANGLGNSVVVNSGGDVFVFGNDYNLGGNMFIKYSSNGTFQWQKAINYSFSYKHLRLGPDGNIYAVLADDFSTRILKLSSSTGNTLNDALIDIGRTVIAFGGSNSVIVFGTVGNDSFGNQCYLYRLNSDFSGDFFSSFSNRFFFDFPPSRYRSVAVESNGNILVNFNQSLNGLRGGVFVRLNSGGTFIGEDKFLNVATTGMEIDYQGNYVFPSDFECMKKLTLCDKLSVSITSQPSSQTVCSGTANVQFNVAATGQGLLYQWRKGTQLLANNSKYSGVHTATLTITGANVLEDAGSYSCLVYDGCYHLATSQNASLNFIGSASITAHPANVSQCPGTDAVFQISATGGQNIKYQWKRGTTTLNESATVIGSKTNQLTLKGIGAGEAGDYTCEVTSDCFAAIISQKATLTLLPATSLTTQPVAVTTCGGSTAVFTIAAGGSGLTYQWKKGANNLTESSLIVGTKSSMLTIKDVKAADAGSYSCVVTGTCGASVTSTAVALTVTSASQITTQPVSKEICAGAATSFTVAATGQTLVYSWRKGNTVLSNGGKYSGVNTATLNISSTTAAEEGQYSCVVSSSCGSDLISNVAQLAIGTAPTITGKSADLKLCAGEIAKMSVTVTGGLVKYKWKKNGTVLTEGNGVLGSTSRELFLENIDADDAGNYTCDVSTDCGAIQVSGPIKLELSNEVTFNESPATQKQCYGEKVSITAPVSGTIQTYQWKKNGVNLANSAAIAGVKTATLVIQSAAAVDEGFYSCEILSGCGKLLVTKDVKLELNSTPNLILLDVNCESFPSEWSSLVVDLNNTFGDYQIFKKGSTTPLSGLNAAKGTGLYVVVKSNGVCSDTVEWNNDCIVTGIEKSVSKLTIAPNPTTGVFTVKFDDQIDQLEMFDARGVSVLSSKSMAPFENIVDASGFAHGVYYLILSTEDGRRISKRIVISK